jgi:hypothetical protein
MRRRSFIKALLGLPLAIKATPTEALAPATERLSPYASPNPTATEAFLDEHRIAGLGKYSSLPEVEIRYLRCERFEDWRAK